MYPFCCQRKASLDLFRCEESGRIVEKSFVRAKFKVKIIWQRGNESARLKSETSLVSEKSSAACFGYPSTLQEMRPMLGNLSVFTSSLDRTRYAGQNIKAKICHAQLREEKEKSFYPCC